MGEALGRWGAAGQMGEALGRWAKRGEGSPMPQ